MRPRLPLLLALACLHEAAGLCHNSCAGHGKCELRDTCLCHKRREQEYDDNLEVPAWTGADCSLRTFLRNPAPSFLSRIHTCTRRFLAATRQHPCQWSTTNQPTVSLYTRCVATRSHSWRHPVPPSNTVHFHFSALSHPAPPHRPTIPWLAPPTRRAWPRSPTLHSLPARSTSLRNTPHLSLPTLLVHFPCSLHFRTRSSRTSPRNLPLRPRVGRHAAKEQRPPAAHRVLGTGRLRAQDRPVRVQAGVLGRGVPPQRLPELVQRARDVPVDQSVRGGLLARGGRRVRQPAVRRAERNGGLQFENESDGVDRADAERGRPVRHGVGRGL